MMLLAIMVFYFGFGITAAIIDYYNFEEMMEEYDNLYLAREYYKVKDWER